MKESALFFIVSLFFAQLGISQNFKMIQASSDSSLLIPEIGVLFQLTEKGLVLEDELPLPEKQKTSLQKGDILFGINGKSTSDVNLIRSIYEKTEINSEIKLGIKRDDQKFIVRFTRKEAPKGMRIEREMNDGPPPISSLIAFGILAQVQENDIIVKQLLPNAQQAVKDGIVADDIILEINEKKVSTVEDIDTIIKALKTDEEFSMKIKHGKTKKTIQLKKISGEFMMKTMKNH